jgi:hypothetical protein
MRAAMKKTIRVIGWVIMSAVWAYGWTQYEYETYIALGTTCAIALILFIEEGLQS